MGIKVQLNTQGSRLAAQVEKQPTINSKLKKIDLSLVKLEELTNVDENVNGLQDGYTLVYDAVSQQWITQALTAQDIDINNIDGGTY